jgi:hypothetical protein
VQTHENEDVVVGGKVGLEPHDRSEIQMRCRLVEEEKMRLDEESSCERDSHPPSSGHVLRGLGEHRGGESETVEDGSGLGLEHGRVELLNLLVDGVEGELVNVVGNRELLSELLETLDLLLGRSDTEVEGLDVGRLDGSSDNVDLGEGTRSGKVWV